MAERNDKENILGSVDSDRRSFLKRVLGASFAVPVIATFSIESLTTDMAYAAPNTANIANTTSCANQGFDNEDLFLSFWEERAPCDATPAPALD